MVTGVAIGQNTYARTGSVMLGTHNYKGALGDISVDSANAKAHNMLPFATALGANSYSHGLFSSVTGSYSIISSLSSLFHAPMMLPAMPFEVLPFEVILLFTP